jgi:hypothetical protein
MFWQGVDERQDFDRALFALVLSGGVIVDLFGEPRADRHGDDIRYRQAEFFGQSADVADDIRIADLYQRASHDGAEIITMWGGVKAPPGRRDGAGDGGNRLAFATAATKGRKDNRPRCRPGEPTPPVSLTARGRLAIRLSGVDAGAMIAPRLSALVLAIAPLAGGAIHPLAAQAQTQAPAAAVRENRDADQPGLQVWERGGDGVSW